MKKITLSLILILVCYLYSLQVRSQSVLYVSSLGDNGSGTLRQQIINAFPGDTIKFQVTGTIFLSTGWIDFAKDIVIKGPGMNNLIITPSSPDRIMRIQNSNVTISDLTIKDGNSTNSSWAGGLTASGGTKAKISRVKFEGNYKGGLGGTPYGGALSCSMSDSILIDSCSFINNWTSKTGSSGGGSGGGAANIYATQSIIIKNSYFDNNRTSAGCDPSNNNTTSTSYGGALHVSGANSSTINILIDSCFFSNNRSIATCTYNVGGVQGRGHGYGGAIHFASVRNAAGIKVSNSTFTLNQAIGNGASTYNYSYGGAISNRESTTLTISTISLENLIIDGNTANGTTFAGPSGVYVLGGGLKMDNCKIINNTSVNSAIKVTANQPVEIVFCDFSDNNGRALYSNVYPPNTQDFRNCLFKGNSNSAIHLAGVSGTTNVINSTFTENSSNGGSSFYLNSNSGQINIMNCTMMNDGVLTAGQPHSLYINNSSNVYMKNNILSIPAFSSNPLFLQTGSTVLTGGGNIVRDASAATFLVASTDMNSTNPLLDTLDNHGGPTYTYSLLPTSPAINLGGADTLSIDQRGFLRINDVDAGAYEFGGVNANEPIVMSIANDTIICSNDTVEIWVLSNDVPSDPIQFQWKLNGSNIVGANDSSYQVQNLTAGIYLYTCELSNNSGSTISNTITVEILQSPQIITTGTATICDGDATTLTATGASSYTWDNGAGSGASVAVSPNATTTYTVTGTDANSCSNTAQVTVTVNPLPTVVATGTATICNGQSTNLSASGASTYSWDNGAGTGSTVSVSPSTTTTYTVTGTDLNTCVNTAQVTVTVNALPTVIASGTAIICNGQSTNLSASGASTYSWDNGAGTGSTVSVSPSTTTTYTVTGTDANTCVNTAQVTVTVNPLPTVVATGTATICDGDATTLTATGASSYAWDNGAGAGASVSVSPTSTTTYTVTGTDANSCSNTAQVTVTVNPLPTVVASGTATICAGDATTLTATGASSYAWDNGAGTGASVSVSPSTTTTYTVTGTDANSCSNTAQVTVTVNPLPTVVATGTATICDGDATTLTATSASSYTWDNGAGTGASVSVSPTATTTYTVTGTDANSCSNTDQVTVTVNPLPTVVYTQTPNIVCENDAPFALTGGSPSGGVYSGTGVSAGNFDPAVAGAGTHTITYSFTDGNNCSNTDTQQIQVDVCAGINEQENQLVTIYPNPFKNEFTVSFSTSGNHTIELFNVLGEQIKLVNVYEQNTVINTDDLPSGIYFLRIIDEKLIFKLLKN